MAMERDTHTDSPMKTRTKTRTWTHTCMQYAKRVTHKLSIVDRGWTKGEKGEFNAPCT